MAVNLYKYLPHEFAARLVADGEVLFRSLLFFLACEHAARGDDSKQEAHGTRGVLIKRQKAPEYLHLLDEHSPERGSSSRIPVRFVRRTFRCRSLYCSIENGPSPQTSGSTENFRSRTGYLLSRRRFPPRGLGVTGPNRYAQARTILASVRASFRIQHSGKCIRVRERSIDRRAR